MSNSMSMADQQYETVSQEHAIQKGIDVVILNLKREYKVRYGVDLTAKELVEIITELAKERTGV